TLTKRKIPVAFVPNVGQAHEAVRFTARAGGLDVYLTRDGLVFGFTDHPHDDPRPERVPNPRHDVHESDSRGAIGMKVVGGKLTAVTPLDPQKGKSHYIIGNDRTKWHRNVAHYGRVQIKDVYPGVDLVLHGESGHAEYDFVVAPGRDHRKIELQFEGM